MGPGRPARPSRRGRRGGTPDWLLANPRCTDANVAQWRYDSEGRLTRKTHADASHYDYTYDAAGRLLTRTDAMSRTTAYTYSATGQVLAVDYPTDPDVSYTYDALGRRLTMTDATGTTTWTYAPATGQPATVTHTNVGAGSTPRLLSYTWDAAGRRLSTAVDGTTLATYTYDAQARMATVTSGSAGVPPASFTYSYLNASNQVTGIDMPGELAVARTYDALGRLAAVTNASGNAAISAFAYAYDQSDRRTRVDLVDGGRWEYSYDNAGQLTGGTRFGPKLDQQEGTLVQYAYQYDAMGNPTSRTEDTGVSAYTFNNLNQLVTGSWSGTLSTFGWTQTQGLASVSVAAGQQTQSATVFQKGEWTAKELTLPAGDNTRRRLRPRPGPLRQPGRRRRQRRTGRARWPRVTCLRAAMRSDSFLTTTAQRRTAPSSANCSTKPVASHDFLTRTAGPSSSSLPSRRSSPGLPRADARRGSLPWAFPGNRS